MHLHPTSEASSGWHLDDLDVPFGQAKYVGQVCPELKWHLGGGIHREAPARVPISESLMRLHSHRVDWR